MEGSIDFKFWEENLPAGEDELFADELRASSPPLWRREETSCRFSCVSPTSRLRAILDGRKELMEMIKNMPESSYELTLKDIVNEQNEEDGQEKLEEEKVEERTPKSCTKQMCRSESMDSQVFLLKMFSPVSLSSGKKKHTRICPQKQSNKDWWKFIFLTMRDHHNLKNTNIIGEKKYKSRGRRGCFF